MSTKWKLDPNHAQIQFRVKHMVISTISGEFEKFDAHIESEKEDFSDAKVNFTAEVQSINTKNEYRDNHLKSADFFDAENHPQLKFTSTKGIHDGKLEGNLEIRGIVKPIVLDVDFGVMDNPEGGKRAGFDITGKLSRKDFGLSWNQLTESGGMIVGDEIKLVANAEFLNA